MHRISASGVHTSWETLLQNSGSQSFFSDVPFGQYFVYQVPLDCNHEHNNWKCTYNYCIFALKFHHEDN